MEIELIDWLKQTYGTHRNFGRETSTKQRGQQADADKSPQLLIGIGDDAALIGVEKRAIVVTSDAIIENVHFDRNLTLEQIGRKALAANLSDLAAMAAQPWGFLVTLCLPPRMNLDHAKRIYGGMGQLIAEFGLVIIGGDTNVGSTELIISVTAIGLANKHGVWRMDSAQSGDRIVVSGSFGGSRLRRHHAFVPRCKLAQYLNENYQINAATDVSDGLSIDLHRMAAASQLGFELAGTRIPISGDVAELSPLARLNAALSHGEDYELILAVPPNIASQLLADHKLDTQLTDIGQFRGDFDDGANCWIVDETGTLNKLLPQGYLH